MRDRLIELLNSLQCKAECCGALDGGRCRDLDRLDRCQIETIADSLLANGVIVLPCQVGDTVYALEYQGIEQCIECECRDYRPYGWEYCEADFDPNPSIGDDNICPLKKMVIVEKKITLAFWEGHKCCFGKTVFLTKEEAEQALKGGAE